MKNKKHTFPMLLLQLFLLLFLPAVNADESAELQQKRERFAIACAGIYEYQYLTGGFDSTLLMYKREMMGQLVYNNRESPHLEDKAYFEGQVKLAYADLTNLPDEEKQAYQHDQWILKPALCDEIAGTVFILISAKEWLEGGSKDLNTAKAILRDIYPWQNEAFRTMQKDLEDQFRHAMKKRGEAKP